MMNDLDYKSETTDAQEEKELKKRIKAEKKETNRIKKDERKARKTERQDQGKYYFWEFNYSNFTRSKILEVNFFFYTTIVFSITLFFSAVFAVSGVQQLWKTLSFVFPAIMIIFAFFNRFMESIVSNIRNQKASLIIQRVMGIFYILVFFTYFFIMIIMMNDGTSIDVRGWIVFNIIVSTALILLKTAAVSLYGLGKL